MMKIHVTGPKTTGMRSQQTVENTSIKQCPLCEEVWSVNLECHIYENKQFLGYDVIVRRDPEEQNSK